MYSARCVASGSVRSCRAGRTNRWPEPADGRQWAATAAAPDRALLARGGIDHEVVRPLAPGADAADDDAIARPRGEIRLVVVGDRRALASPGDQTYTSGPVEPSSGMAEKASMEPLGDQSGGAPALWTLSRIERTAGPGWHSRAEWLRRQGRQWTLGWLRIANAVGVASSRQSHPTWSGRGRVRLVALLDVVGSGIITTAITSSPTVWPTSASWLPLGLSATLPARMSAGRRSGVRMNCSDEMQSSGPETGQTWLTSVW